MARTTAELPDPAALRALVDEQGRLAIRVTPGVRSEAVTISDGHVAVKVRAKPQDGAANDAVIRLVAKALGLAPSRLKMLRGATSREKLLLIAA
jgi:uncharacterized protein YggU (UPF0235/DUF167 family)